MMDNDEPDDIGELEAEIERLARVAEGCRKIILAAKVAIGLGAVMLIATVSGLISFDPLIFVGSMTLIIGGIVAAGSNETTLHNTEAEMGAKEALRSRLIDGLHLAVVRDS
jgi:hypothetical protein